MCISAIFEGFCTHYRWSNVNCQLWIRHFKSLEGISQYFFDKFQSTSTLKDLCGHNSVLIRLENPLRVKQRSCLITLCCFFIVLLDFMTMRFSFLSCWLPVINQGLRTRALIIEQLQKFISGNSQICQWKYQDTSH